MACVFRRTSAVVVPVFVNTVSWSFRRKTTPSTWSIAAAVLNRVQPAASLWSYAMTNYTRNLTAHCRQLPHRQRAPPTMILPVMAWRRTISHSLTTFCAMTSQLPTFGCSTHKWISVTLATLVEHHQCQGGISHVALWNEIVLASLPTDGTDCRQRGWWIMNLSAGDQK